MNTQKIFRGIFALLATTCLLVAMTYSQGNVTVYADVTGAGTMNVSGNLTNAKGAALNIANTVNMRSNSTAQAIQNSSGTWTINFTNATTSLQFGRNGDKSIGTSISVSGPLAFGYASNTLGGAVSLGSNTLTIADATSYSPSGTPTLTFSSGTVQYTDTDAGQSIFSRTGGITYGTLVTSGNSKTAANAITVTTAFTNSQTVDFGTYAFTGTGATFSNSGTLRSGGTGTSVTLGVGTTVNGTFEYYTVGGSLTVADATYSGTLNLSGTSTKTVSNVVLGDVYTAAGGTRTYTGTVQYTKEGAQSIQADAYNNLTLSGSGVKSFSGTASVTATLNASDADVNVTISSGTTTLGSSSNFGGNLVVDGTLDADAASSTTTFSGASQSISTTGSGSITGFYDLTLSGSAAKSSSLTLAVNNTFTPTRGIAMTGSSVLNITNSAAAAVGSFGSMEEVSGKMQRAVTTTGVYTMNNSATSVDFTTEAPTTFALTVSPATAPTGYGAATHVNRKVIYDYSGAWANGTAQLVLAYTNAEKPSANENMLRFFEGSASAANKVATGASISRTAAGGSFGTLDLTGIRPSGAGSGLLAAQITAGNEVVMSNLLVPYITTANSAVWGTGGSWDEGVTPTASDDAQISHTGITIGADAYAATLTIDADKGLSVNAGSATLAVTTLNINGELDVTSGQTLTVSGTLTNNNSNGSLTSTFAGSATIGALTNSAGTIAFDNGATVNGNVVNNGTITKNSTGTLLLAQNASTNVTGTGTFTLDGAITVGTGSNANSMTINNLDVNATGVLQVYGDLSVNTSFSNDGVITVGQ